MEFLQFFFDAGKDGILVWIWKSYCKYTVENKVKVLLLPDGFQIEIAICIANNVMVMTLNSNNLNCSSHIWYSHIYSNISTTLRVYLEPTWWPAPTWLVSLVGRALHWYQRSHGFQSCTGLNFFQALFSLLLKWCSWLRLSPPFKFLQLQFTHIIFIHLQSFIQ